MDWVFNGDPCLAVPEGYHHFVYIIRYTDGKMYIGKKTAKSLRRKKPLKGMRVNAKRMVMTEHKWKDYEGSSDFIADRTIASKEILGWFKGKQAATYVEASLMFSLGVLFKEEYLNRNILGSFYRNVLQEEDSFHEDNDVSVRS